MVYNKAETLLKAENVSKKYGDKVILRDINFEIRNITRPGLVTGQCVSLVGRSGSGKSTLAYILANLTPSDTGKVLINDVKGFNPVETGQFGVVFQNYFVYYWRVVYKILEMSVKKNPAIPKDDRKAKILEVAEQFNLIDHFDKYPKDLSGGQKQRVAIAEQILNGGNFIFLDEPFSGLDTLTVEKVTNMLVNVTSADELKTLIIVSHNLEDSIAISDTVFVLATEEGKPGATITKEINLIDRGLAWQKDIKGNPYFIETVKEVKSLI